MRDPGPLLAAFEKLVADRADAPAIFALSEQRVLTFEDLAAEAQAVRDALDAARVPDGSCVVDLVGNRASWFALFVACLARSNTLVSLSAEAPSSEVDKVSTRYHAAAIVRSLPGSDAGAGGVTTSRLPGGLELAPCEHDDPAPYPDALVLKLTSGSSGEPKAVVVSEENLYNDGRHIVDAMGIGSTDVNYGVIPLSHSYGLGNLVAPLLIRGTGVALRELFLPSQLVEDARATAISVLPGVPFLFEQILNQLGDAALPPSLRLLVSAGARIERPLVVSFKKRLAVKIHSFYGSSETGGITYDDDEDILDPLTVGTAMPETEVTIDRDERVHVSGNAVAAGYVEPSDGETGQFADSGFLTGDLGRFDDRRRLFLTGRLSTFVNVAGRKVNPGETEDVLRTMPGVRDAKVIGLACDRRGQKLVAFIVPRSNGLSPLEVRSYCARELSPHKIPRDMILLDELPRTDRGKIDRNELERLARSQ